MSAHIKILYFLVSLFILNCYTFEFHPTDEYPNLKKSNVKKVTLLTVRPIENFSTLGTLIIHDFSGNIQEPSFQAAIKREAKKRGAEGAWIAKIQLKKTVRLQGGASSGSRNYMQNNYYSTGQIEGMMGIVEVILFNYLKPDSTEKDSR